MPTQIFGEAEKKYVSECMNYPSMQEYPEDKRLEMCQIMFQHAGDSLEPENTETNDAYVARCMLFPEMQQYPENERRARCVNMYAVKGTSNQQMEAVDRKIGFDTSALDSKVLVDDDKYLVMSAVIASEIVHQYSDGWAYKPAEELEKMAAYASDIGSVPVKILEHPRADTNYLLLKHSDVQGRAENFQFVKNLPEPKTGRPMRRGVKADIRWFKNRVDASVIEQIKSGTLHDVSIGFTFDNDHTPGEFGGVHYDYVQRNIFLNHVAAPIEAGRCPGPICGIGYDSTKIQLDAKVIADCPVCSHMKDVGWNTAGKRLYQAYGPDVLEVIDTGALPPKPEPQQTSLDQEFTEAFSKLSSSLNRDSASGR